MRREEGCASYIENAVQAHTVRLVPIFYNVLLAIVIKFRSALFGMLFAPKMISATAIESPVNHNGCSDHRILLFLDTKNTPRLSRSLIMGGYY